jgi:hypothetical protein
VFFHSLDFGLETGQIGLQFGDLFGLGLKAALKVVAAMAAALAVSLAAIARVSVVAATFTLMIRRVFTLTHRLAPLLAPRE